jgi:hypothetical protein
MKTINIIAVVKGETHADAARGLSRDPKFVPLKLTFPDFEYDMESLEKIIQRIDSEAVAYDYGYPIIHRFEDEHSKMLRDSMDWSKATDLKYKIEEDFAIWEWETVFAQRRVRELEPKIAEFEDNAEKYVKKCRNIDWINWTEEELLVSPVFMFNYALKVCKGRLPDHLDSAMNMESFKNPDSKHVKRYFKTKRYRTRSGKSLLLQKS